jgi:hypothetical protein
MCSSEGGEKAKESAEKKVEEKKRERDTQDVGTAELSSSFREREREEIFRRA